MRSPGSTLFTLRIQTGSMAAIPTRLGRKLKIWLAQRGYHTRPAFMVIGAQKSGTKALRQYLVAHPQITQTAHVNEIHFFDNDAQYARDIAHYHRYFPLPFQLGAGNVTFDNTPDYLATPQVPARIHAYDPAIKLIAVLRDPVKRAFSAWNMYRQQGSEARDFATCVQEDIARIQAGDTGLHASPVGHGLYAEQIERYLQYFDRAQLVILHSDDLRHATQPTLDRVIAFLELSPYRWPASQLDPVHVRQYGQSMDSDTRAALRAFYRPYNATLFDLLGRDFGWNDD